MKEEECAGATRAPFRLIDDVRLFVSVLTSCSDVVRGCCPAPSKYIPVGLYWLCAYIIAIPDSSAV